MYKLIVSDLDGTLLNENHRLSDITKKVLRTLKKRGVDIIIATGRPYYDALRIYKDLDLKIPLVLSNGASLYDENAIEFKRYELSENVKEKILNLEYDYKKNDVVLNIVADDKWYLKEEINEDNIINEFCDEEFYYEIKDDFTNMSISKFYYVGEHEKLVELEKIIKEVLDEDVNFAYSMPWCLEIFPKEALKSYGVKEICKKYSYNLNDSVSFGDGMNDVEMLRETTKGYYMENSGEKLKEALSKTHEMIGSNKDNAVAYKLIEIYKLRMEELE